MTAEIVLRPFVPADQAEVRRLVLAGLADHFGEIDETRNPDLDDIAGVYLARGAVVLVAERDGRIVGTGTLTTEGPGVSRLVRMSVSRSARGQGLGRRLTRALIDAARRRGDVRILVETTDDWTDAIGLYLSCGFTEDARRDGDIHFKLDL